MNNFAQLHFSSIKMLYLLFCSLLLSLCSGQDNCPSACQCPNKRMANCARIGVDPMSLNLNPQYTDLNFTYNTVGAVRKEMYAQRVDMEFLYLRHNKITEIESGIFDHNPKLTALDLSYNMLKTLPPDLFKNNKALERLSCQDNNLTEITSELFDGLTKLKDVRLNNNQLIKISPSAFVKNRQLSRLYIYSNHLETAYKQWFSHFDHSGTFDLIMYDNPWSCDCRMQDFRNHTKAWETPTHSDINHRVELPKCHFPDGRKPHMTDVAVKDFVCEKPTMNPSNNCSATSSPGNVCTITIKEGSSGKMECSGVGKPIPEVQILRRSGMPYTQSVKGSVIVYWSPAVSKDAGEYICSGKGVDANGNPASFTNTITVVVESNGSSVLGIVLALLALAILVMVAAFYYRHRYRKRAGYGSLSRGDSDALVHYEVTNGGNRSHSSEVTYMDDENAVIEEDTSVQTPVKDNEKEVLV